MNRRTTAGLWVVVLAVAGCGSKYGAKVPDSMVNTLTYENKVDLVEAENDLFVAYDKVDEAENEISRTRDQIRRAKKSESLANDEIGQAKDQPSKEVALLAREEAQARVDYLRARQDLNVRNRSLDELNRTCAIARYQLARLQAVRKVKVPGSEKYDPKDFERQVASCQAELAEKKKSAKPERERMEKARAEWEKKRDLLARKTFDARASPFVEKL
jgi:phage gp36-like protein